MSKHKFIVSAKSFISKCLHAPLLLTLLFWCVATVAMAQQFSISHTVTNSDCAANGSITVNVNSDLPAGTRYQYLLQNAAGSGEEIARVEQDETSTATTYTFTDLKAGQYNVSVQAVGTGLLPQNINDITITSTYTPLFVAVDQVNSRTYSYPCGTGKMIFNISGGKQPYTARVVSGPMAVGQTLSTTLRAGTTDSYAIEGESWLPGSYTIEVSDACGSKKSYPFEITAISEVFWPSTIWRPTASQTECDVMDQSLLFKNLTIGQKQHIRDGLMEIGIKYTGMSDADIVWYTMNEEENNYHIKLPKSVYELYANDWTPSTDPDKPYLRTYGYDIYTRVKPCPEYSQKASGYSEMDMDIQYTGTRSWCWGAVYFYVSHTDGYYPLCHPLTYEFYKIDGENETFLDSQVELTKNIYENNKTVEIPGSYFWNLPKDNTTGKLRLKVRDKNGVVITRDITVDITPTPIARLNGCTYDLTFELKLYFNNQTSWHGCPFNGVVYDLQDNKIGEFSNTNNTITGLTPGATYKIEANYYRKQTYFFTMPMPDDFQPTITRFQPVITYSDHQQNYASFDLRINGEWNQEKIPLHVDITGPNNFEHTYYLGGEEYELLPSNSFYKFENIINGYRELPEGTYTFKLSTPCKVIDSAKIEYKGGYIVKDFSYTVDASCGERYLVPSAVVYRDGVQVSPDYYAFFVHPKNNYVEQTVVRQGQRIKISTEGEYIVSVVTNDPTTGSFKEHYSTYATAVTNNAPDDADYRLSDHAVSFYATPLTIDPDRSLAYVCTSLEPGNIHLTAAGGVPPYTYRLYTNEELTVPARYANGTAVAYSGAGAAAFRYGSLNETVYILVSDACNNSYRYKTHLLNIDEVKVAYARPPKLCEGETITLIMTGPEVLRSNSTISWYKPGENLAFSTSPTVTIPHATRDMSGTYRAVITFPGCGTEVNNTVDVAVSPAYTLTEPPVTSYDVCVGKPLTIAGPTSTTPIQALWYQAKVRRNNALHTVLHTEDEYIYTWYDTELKGTVTNTQLNTQFMAPGTYILRPTITGEGGGCVQEGDLITVNVKACTVPLNPHLMHRPFIDWSQFNSKPTTIIQ